MYKLRIKNSHFVNKQEETTSVKSEKEEGEAQPTEETTNTAATSDSKPSKTIKTRIISANPSTQAKETPSEVEQEEYDPKIFLLKKFPTTRKHQMNLLKV